jgi:hypothetical protein
MSMGAERVSDSLRETDYPLQDQGEFPAVRNTHRGVSAEAHPPAGPVFWDQLYQQHKSYTALAIDITEMYQGSTSDLSMAVQLL